MAAPPPTAEPSALPAPLFWPLAGCALSALLVLWLPLAVLQELDALLVFVAPAALWRDVALLVAVIAGAGLVLAALARTGGIAAALLGCSARLQRRIAWGALLLPAGWLVLWQLTRSARLWLQVSTGLQFSIGPHTRVIGIAVLALLALLLAWRFGATRAGRRAIGMLLALRGPAFVLLAAALATLLIAPPLWHPGPAVRDAPAPAAASATDIVLISIDALAADDAAVCGDGPTTMPQLRRLAARSSCFTRLYAGSNFTTPTTSTMETGTLPWTHLATQIAARVLPPVQQHSLAVQLRAAGYRTHFVTDNFLASPRHHGTWRGYDSDRYARSALLRNRLREALTVWPDSQLPLLLDTVLSFIGAFDVYLHADTNPYVSGHVFGAVPALLAERPSFVWAHTMPPHTPYLPTPGFKDRLLPAGELDHWHQMMGENIPYSPNAQALVDKHRLRYRESMMGADDALGRLLDELQRQGRLDGALVIVTSDHGESFERNFIGHAGPLLHDAVIRVPLVVKLPGQTLGRIVDQPVSQADLAPTLLDIAGAPPLPRAEGRSLRSLLEGGTLAPAPVFSMSLERQSRFEPIAAGHYAVIDGPHKLVWHLADDSAELYDLAADPRERSDLADRQPEVAGRLKGLLRERVAAAEAARSAWAARPR